MTGNGTEHGRGRAILRVLALTPLFLFVAGNAAAVFVVLTGRFFRGILFAYRFNTWVMAAVLIVCGLILLRRSAAGNRAGMTRFAGYIYAISGVVAFGVYIYATHIEPRMLVIREVRMEHPSVSVPLRILHISDIQSAGVGSYEEEVFSRIRDLNPDLVLCTGDFLQPLRPATMKSELPKLAALFSTLHPPMGVYGVYGTADGWLTGRSRASLGGVRMLENSSVSVTSGATRVKICGLSLRESGIPAETIPRLAEWTESRQDGEVCILMGHVPDFSVAAQDFPFDLCLAGHTHGGQIRLPYFGPIVTLTRHIPRDWALGFRRVGKTALNVSGGVGSEHAGGLPNIRFFCRPEMTLITLEGTSAAR